MNANRRIRTWCTLLILGGLSALGSTGALFPAALSTASWSFTTATAGAYGASTDLLDARPEATVDPFEDGGELAATQSVAFSAVSPEVFFSFASRHTDPFQAPFIASAVARAPPST